MRRYITEIAGWVVTVHPPSGKLTYYIIKPATLNQTPTAVGISFPSARHHFLLHVMTYQCTTADNQFSIYTPN